MNFVDNNVAQVAKQTPDRRVAVEQQRLERFRSDLQDAARLFEKLRLVGRGDIPVPSPDRDVRFLAKGVEPLELIVDEGLERADI